MGAAFTIRDRADIAAIERVPLAQRLAATDTYALIRHGAAIAPDAPALIVLEDADPQRAAQVVTHRDFARRVTQAANLFAALGVGPGEVVASLLPNMAQSHEVIWGAEAAGIACLLNPLLETEHLVHLLESARARVLVVPADEEDAEIAQRCADIAARVPGLRAVLRAGAAAGTARAGQLPFDELRSQQPPDRLVSGRVIRGDDIASYFHTGGTTGLPRLARHTHHGEVYQAWALAAHCDIRAGDRIMVGLPLFHNSPVINLGLAPFSVGAAAVLLGKRGFRDPELIRNFWRLVQRHRGTFFVAVPTVYDALLQHPVAGDVRSLRYALCGAAPAPERLVAETERRTGVRILEGYGLTEATCGAACNPKDGASRLGSVGLALAYQPMKVVQLDADGRWRRDCAPDEIGNLVIKGPGVFPGYLDPAHDRGVFVGDGWLNTGDLARQDADGYFWIVGRAKDVIIRGGHNIDPAQIEEALQAHPAVRMAAAVGRPDPHAGELPVAYVVPAAGTAPSPQELLDFARRHIGERAAAPVAVTLVEQLPLTAVGKISKQPLRHDATRVAIETLLNALDPPPGEFRVAVRADARHGTVAQVAVAGVPGGARDAVRAAVEAQLARLALHVELTIG
jgi:fatty-acyl-CoA synthase